MDEEFVTANRDMIDLRRYVFTLAACSDPLFITGEAGTGKTLLAGLIHQEGGRKGPFHVLSGGLSPFDTTGDPAGRSEIEKAEGGTLCVLNLAEIGEADQRNLLRFLETGEYLNPESGTAIRSNVRFLFESRPSLDELLRRGGLRLDLYYYLKAHEIRILPLRERPDDIIPLAEFFYRKAIGNSLDADVGMSQKVKFFLCQGRYPENARELRMKIFNAVYAHPGRKLSARSLY